MKIKKFNEQSENIPDIDKIEKEMNETSPGEWKYIHIKMDSNWGSDIEFVEMVDRPYGDYMREIMSDEDYDTKTQDLKWVANSKNYVQQLIDYIKQIDK